VPRARECRSRSNAWNARGVFVREGKQIQVHERSLRRYLERKYEFLL
jgi:hypothetical protein